MISGKKIRLAGKGEMNPYGGPAGDLYIKSKVMDDPVYRCEEYDLYVERKIKLTEAILGTSISVPTITGKELSLKIPAGTKHKTKMRLSGHGLPHMQGRAKGDLYVIVDVNIPKQLTSEQRKLIDNLAASGL
jgi:curved DNA-binding protein